MESETGGSAKGLRMNFAYCWHRPGRVLRGEIRQCRHCGVAIEECPCVVLQRNVMPGCTACEGSGWVGILRSKSAAVKQMLGIAS